MKRALAAILALLLIAGCSQPSSGGQSQTPQTVPFTDSAGRSVEVPADLTKISPSGALAQMFLLAIAPDLMVTKAAEYDGETAKYIPSSLGALPVVGQFYGSEDLNFETIASIGPQIVIDIGEPKNTIIEDMDSITTNLAIPAVHITATLQSTPEAFRTLGKLLKREAKGEELAKYCEKVLAQTEEVMQKVAGKKAKALFLVGESGQNVIAKTSFHAELFDYLTDNLAIVDSPSSKGTGNETDLEQISSWNPEVIVFGPNSAYKIASTDPVWSELSAVKSGRYYEAPYGPYNWMGSPPSINRYLGMIWLTKTLYPDSATYDLYAETSEYYKLFYGYDLTNEEYSLLTANAFGPKPQ